MNDVEARIEELLAQPVPKMLLSAAPLELREAYEGDLHERLRLALSSRQSFESTRRWLRRELLASVPRMLGRRALGGGTAWLRWIVAAGISVLAAFEIIAPAFRPAGPVTSAVGCVLVATFVLALLLRASAWVPFALCVVFGAIFPHLTFTIARRPDQGFPLTSSVIFVAAVAIAAQALARRHLRARAPAPRSS